MDDEPSYKGLEESNIPSEFNPLKERYKQFLNRTVEEVDAFYGIREEDSYIRLYHATTEAKLQRIATEGLKAFHEPGKPEPRIYCTPSPIRALWHVVTDGPHDRLVESGAVQKDTSDPALLVLVIPKYFLSTHPDSQKSLIMPQWIKKLTGFTGQNDTRLSAFMNHLRKDVENVKNGRNASVSGVPLPVDNVPPAFIFVENIQNGSLTPVQQPTQAA